LEPFVRPICREQIGTARSAGPAGTRSRDGARNPHDVHRESGIWATRPRRVFLCLAEREHLVARSRDGAGTNLSGTDWRVAAEGAVARRVRSRDGPDNPSPLIRHPGFYKPATRLHSHDADPANPLHCPA